VDRYPFHPRYAAYGYSRLHLLRHCNSEGAIQELTVPSDYDRLKFAPKETQLKHFPPLLDLSKEFNLPLFLHSRASDAHVDFVRILQEAGWSDEWAGGVVHSFTGTREEMEELVSSRRR